MRGPGGGCLCRGEREAKRHGGPRYIYLSPEKDFEGAVNISCNHCFTNIPVSTSGSLTIRGLSPRVTLAVEVCVCTCVTARSHPRHSRCISTSAPYQYALYTTPQPVTPAVFAPLPLTYMPLGDLSLLSTSLRA